MHGRRPDIPGSLSLAPGLISIAVAASACLPEETRSTPGTLEVSVVGDAAVLGGFTTADGWRLRYSTWQDDDHGSARPRRARRGS